MKKITFLALHLGYGGIEKCISTLANSLSDKYEVEIISTYKLYDKPKFKINDNIKIKYLMNYGPNRKEINTCLKKHKYITLVKEMFKAYRILRNKKKLMINAIKKCDSDIIISTRDIHNEWLGKFAKKGIIKIGWEHNYHNNNQAYINKIVNSVKDLDYFVLVSNSLKEFYQTRTKTKCIYIPNTLDYYPTKFPSLEEKNIISVGRLSYEKGFDDLIDIFSLVNKIYPDWNLNIIGDGFEYNKLQKKIENYKLEDKIKLHGYQDKEYINEQLYHSSIYVLPSRSESFGIVILEAFSFGIPAIAFTRASGATELINDGWNGFLIKDSDKELMAKRICELIKNTNRRIIFGHHALEKSKEYNIEKIKEEWIKIIGD